MVSAAPNRSLVVGRVDRLRAHPGVAQWDVLSVLVDSVDTVEGAPGVLGATPGRHLDVVVDRRWLPQGPLVGATVRFDATLAGPDLVKVAYAEPALTVLDPRDDAD